MTGKIASDKVAIYIRWSTEDQGLGHTLEIQRESCRYYCLSQGWAVRDDLTYIDEGYSGGSLERPALARLRQAVKDRRVDCVVLYKLDRLSRNIKDIINLVLDEWEETCSVRSTQEPVDTTSDAGRMFFTMLGSFADFERASIKTRTWSGKKKNAEKGRNPGVLYSYGLQKGEDGGWEIHEAEAAVVREVFDLYVKGKSCRLIAFALNERGITTRSGRMWQNADISRLLANPIYIGRLVYNRRNWAAKKKTGRVLEKDPAEVVTTEGAAPSIVPMEVWEQVQRARTSRPRIGREGASARTHSSPHLLSGLVRCARCGHAWVAVMSGRGCYYYQCAGARSAGPAKCNGRMIKCETLDQFVADRIRERWPLKGAFRAGLFAQIETQLADHETQTRLLRQRYGSLAETLDRFRRDYKNGVLGGKEYTELTEEVRLEREALAARLQRADEERQRIEAGQVDLRRAEVVYAQLDAWQSLQVGERQQLLRLLVCSIALDRPKGQADLTMHINWRLPALAPPDGARWPGVEAGGPV